MSGRDFVFPTGSPEELGFSLDGLARIDRVLCREIDDGIIPGAVVMIGRDGHVAHHKALGCQNPATGEAMRPDSLFRIFSMTKAITSTAALMLMEEGLLSLEDPLSKYIPAFADTPVARFEDGMLIEVPRETELTIRHLFLHTAGLSHETIKTPLQQVYADRQLARRDRSNEEHAAEIARLPLLCNPGAQWNYSRAIEVLGRVVEVISGQSLGEFMRARIFEPLGMDETGFTARPADAAKRLAEPFPADPWTGKPVALYDMLEVPAFEAGGGGLVSTAPDYARFAQMILNRGVLGGTRLLGSRTVDFMLADHLPASLTHRPDPLPPGYGFGLGFAIRTHRGQAPNPGSPGQFFWNGVAGTQFWGDPAEGLWAMLMVQAPGQRDRMRNLIRNLVYAALGDRPAF